MSATRNIDELSAPTKDLLKEEARDIITRQHKLARQLIKSSEGDSKLDSCLKSNANMDSVITSTGTSLMQIKQLLAQNHHQTDMLCSSFERCLSAKAHADSVRLHKYS